MRAIQYEQFGDPATVLAIVEEQVEAPRPDEVVVAVEATPVMLNDLYHVNGKADFRRPLPAVPGNQGVGRIAAAGAQSGWREGDRVFLPSKGGTWRDRILCPATGLFRAPEGGDPVQLSLVSGNLLTAYLMLRYIRPLHAGEWIVQNASNSNCGGYVIRLARAWGMRTVNIVRRPSLVDPLKKMGADAVVLDDEHLTEAVQAATGGAPILLGLDAVAGAATDRMARCLAPNGIVATYGFISSTEARISVGAMMFNAISLIGFFKSRTFAEQTRERQREIYDEMGRMVVDGRVWGEIAGVFPFSSFGEAVRLAAQTGTGRHGKVILVPQ